MNFDLASKMACLFGDGIGGISVGDSAEITIGYPRLALMNIVRASKRKNGVANSAADHKELIPLADRVKHRRTM